MFTYHGVSFAPDEILVYLRKSRADDPLLTVEETLEKHEDILDEWSRRNIGSIIPEGNKFREIVSGETIQARPEIQKILRLVEGTKHKAILTVDVQRLSRGDLEDAGRIIKLLRYTNTFVITPDMVFDLNDEYDRERFKRDLERGNDYLEYYKKINLRGRHESVRSGYFIGSIPPYGYDKVFVQVERKKRPTLAINENEAAAVRMIFDLYVNHNMGMTTIARRLNDLGFKTRKGGNWSTYTIKDILSNEHYIGKVRWNWRKTMHVVEDGEITATRPKSKDYYVFDGVHPAIIDVELFERAQAKHGKNYRAKADTKLRNPLAGMVYCQCGRAMTYRTYKTTEGTERSAPRLLCDNQSYCHTQSVTYDDILRKVTDILRNNIADFEIQLKNQGVDDTQNQAEHAKRLTAQLEELEKKELAQWEKYSEEGMPKAVFDKLNEKVLLEKETVKKALETVQQTVVTVADYREKITRFYDALTALEDTNASAQRKNKLLRACIERIVYKREGGTRWAQTEFELDVTLNI